MQSLNKPERKEKEGKRKSLRPRVVFDKYCGKLDEIGEERGDSQGIAVQLRMVQKGFSPVSHNMRLQVIQ